MGKTLAPRVERLLAALAPPPGTTCVSRCFRMRTGASRETREMSPKRNSSATKSPRRTTVFPGNFSMHSARSRRSTEGETVLLAGGRFIAVASSTLRLYCLEPGVCGSFHHSRRDGAHAAMVGRAMAEETGKIGRAHV